MTKHPVDRLRTPGAKEWRDKLLAQGLREGEMYFVRDPDGSERVCLHKAGLFAFARRMVSPVVALEVLQRQGVVLSIEEEVDLVFGGEGGHETL